MAGIAPSRAGGGRRPSLCVGLHMTDEDVVQRAKEVIGAGRKILREVSTSTPQPGRDVTKWKDSFVLRVYGADAERVMRLIRPRMGERRGAKIDSILSAPTGTYSHQPRRKEAPTS